MDMDNFEDFDLSWAVYPRKVGKGAARRIFARIKPDSGLLAKMRDAIEIQRESVQWQKDGGQFIPHPATWLNQERWDDEVKIIIEPKKQELCWCGKPVQTKVLGRWGCCYDHATKELG